jgi:SAM-dependent methyltransferase
VTERGETKPRLLHLACGDQAHPDWVNVEFFPHSVRYSFPVLGALFRRGARQVTSAGAPLRLADLRRGIPFPDASFDAVYHSHFLEHLDRPAASRFLRECLRVLRPGGVMRVVVPDLEVRAREYLAALEAARRGEQGADLLHEWSVVDIVDQMTRTDLGGEMQAWIDAGWPWRRDRPPAPRPPAARPGLRARISRLLVGPPTPERTGELHRWWYDSYSLVKLLRETGFEGPELRRLGESAIPDWKRYEFETLPDGSPRHPGSLYAEARKPR